MVEYSNEMERMDCLPKKDNRTKVVSFRITPDDAKDLESIINLLKVSRGEWLQGVINRDKNALGHIKQTVIDLNSLVEIIGILKTYAIFAPSRFEMVRMVKALEKLESDLRKAIAEAPSFL